MDNKQIILDAKTKIEMQREQEILEQKQIADNDLIAKKFAEIEQAKSEQITRAQSEYNQKIATITQTADAQKENFRDRLYKEIEQTVSAKTYQILSKLDELVK